MFYLQFQADQLILEVQGILVFQGFQMVQEDQGVQGNQEYHCFLRGKICGMVSKEMCSIKEKNIQR